LTVNRNLTLTTTVQQCKFYILTTDLLVLTVTGKRQTRPPVRERPTSTSLQPSDSNEDLVLSPRWVLYSKTDWPTDRRSNTSLTLTTTQLRVSGREWSMSLVNCED
jgi:hypothetical protein